MHGRARHGRDYTPLFRFLLSKVGGDWDAIHAEAVSRLDTPEPIFWLVALNEADRKPYVRIGGCRARECSAPPVRLQTGAEWQFGG